MKNATLKRIVGDFMDAVPAVVTSARRHNGGACMVCGSPRGTQYEPDCAIWKLIDARISFRVADEGLTRPTAPINRTEVMRVLEGAEYSPAELEFTQAATASEEWRLA